MRHFFVLALCHLWFSWTIFAQAEKQFTLASWPSGGSLVPAQADRPLAQKYWTDELLVKLGPGQTPDSASVKSALRQASRSAFYKSPNTGGSCEFGREFGNGYSSLRCSGLNFESLQAMQASLAKEPAFRWVSLSPVVTAFQTANSGNAQPANDSLVNRQWQLWDEYPGSIGWTKLPKVRADHVYNFIADSGICFGHEDFDWSRYFWGLNVLDPGKPPTDDFGHGCAVTGVIHAVANNSRGITGLADFAWLGSAKVLNDKGEGRVENVVAGITEITKEARRIKSRHPFARFTLTMSFGVYGKVPPIDEAVRAAREAGIICIAAAGNNGRSVDRSPVTPCVSDGVICVGASDWMNNFGAFETWASNWGKSVLLAAPGRRIVTTVPKTGPLGDPSGYRELEGTSLSDPHVTSAIDLMFAKSPEISEEQVRIRLMDGVRINPLLLNMQEYPATELFRSASRLNLVRALDEDWEPPSQPYLVAKNVGHSSAVIEGVGTESPFGIQCWNGEQKILDMVPFFGMATSQGFEVLLRGSDNSPLQEDSDYSPACRIVDRSGNWSATSLPLDFRTAKSRSSQVDLAYATVEPGPMGKAFGLWYGENPRLWHPVSFALLSEEPVWYAGRSNALDFAVGNCDSELVSPEIDLTAVSGSVSLHIRQLLHILPLGMFSNDIAEIWVETTEGSKVVTDSLPNNLQPGLEEYGLDLTEFAGQKIKKVKFRLFTAGGSSGMGWMIHPKLELRTDSR